jgi:hypothetical protein
MPIGGEPAHLAPSIAKLRARAADAGRPTPEVVAMTVLPLDDAGRTRERVDAFAEAGVTRIVHAAGRYDLEGFRRAADALGALTAAG